MGVKQSHAGLVALYSRWLFLLPLSSASLSFRQPGDSHHLMQIPSGIGVMSSAYGVVNFVLLRTRMKLTGLMESSTSLYVTSLFLPKNTIVGN